MTVDRTDRKWALLLTAALVLGGCAQTADPAAETESQEEAAVAVKTVSAELGTLAVSNEFIGTVSPQQQVTVMPMVSGEVDQVYFDVGDEVKAGDVLFHIKDEAAKLQKENAELTRRSAEITAQMQLGSSQVMNNVSMQSNIRSIEFQIENAKDQYQSAVDGIIDAQEAKAEMEDALSGIESSLAEMNANQAKRSEVVANAERYIAPGGAMTGEYRYRVAYDHPLSPDHYQWGVSRSTFPMGEYLMSDAPEGRGTEETEETPENGGSLPEPGNRVPDPSGSEPSETETAKPGETQTEETESSGESEDLPSASEESSEESHTSEGAADGGTEPSGSTEGQTQSSAEQTESEADPGSSEQLSEVSLPGPGASGKKGDAQDGRKAAGREIFVYFAELPQPPGSIPRADVSEKEAWDAYREQQQIDAAAKAAEELGYDAYDIGSGAAASDVMEHAVQIAALEYQASQLRSNQATLDGNIDQAVSARDTTEKTIDFYEDNLQDAQVTYGIANGQAYQDSAAALATQMQAADVGIKSANLQLEYYSPASPISGTVVSRSVEQYGLAQPGYAAFVISNQDAMNVTFAVSEQVRANLYVGMPVTLEKNGSTYTGTIMEIGEAVDAQSGGLFTVKAVTEAGGDQLISGTAVKLTVDTFRTENAVLIPYDAVHFESEQAYVFVISEGDTAVRTPVTLGLMNEDMVEVTEGLSAGDLLVSTWSTQLEDGIRVRRIGAQDGSEGTGE